MPPIDYDYSDWQDQLNILALPYGFNTFAMFQVGRKEDFFLAVSDHNCPRYKRDWDNKKASIENNWYGLAAVNARHIMTGHTVQQVCEYYQWAWTTYRTVQYESEFEYMRQSVCPGFWADMNQGMADVNSSNEYVITAKWMSTLATQVSTSYVAPSEDTKTLKNW